MTTEELKSATPEELRRYIKELEEDNERLAGDIAELEEERDEITAELEKEREQHDAEEEDARDACDDIAGALENFIQYQGQAGGEWYKKDLRKCLEDIAGAFWALPSTKGALIESLITSTY